MVSWFRFLDARWNAYEHHLRPNGHSAAIQAHEGFNAIKASSPNSIEAGFKAWLKGSKDCPGAVMVVRGKGNSNKGMVDIIHHLKQVNKNKKNEAIVVGVDGLGAATIMVGVLMTDMFCDLSVTKKTRSVAMKDRYVPTIEGLMEDRHPIVGKFAPRILDECDSVDSIRDLPNSIFVPFPILELIWNAESNEDDEESISFEGGTVPPRALLLRLVAGANEKKEKLPQWFKEWRGAIQNVVTFLWAHVHDLSSGNHLVTVINNRKWSKHAVRCSHELLEFIEGLGGGSSDSSGDSNEITVARGGGRKRPEFEAEHSTNSEHTGAARVGESSARLRRDLRSSDRVQPARKLLQFLERRDSSDSDGELGETGRADNRKPAAVNLPPRPINNTPQRPETEQPSTPPAGEDEWATQLIQGVLASTKAMEKAGMLLQEFAIVNKNNIEKKDEKKKATSRWLPSAVFLFRVLSAEDGWLTMGIPELTEFAVKITEMKIFQATQLIRDKAKEESWPGGILKAGISDFLKRGFMAEDIQVAPSGFSVLFFHPSGYTEIDGEDFGLQQIREVFGDGEMPEEIVKAFSKRQIFVPQNTYQAADQIKTAVKFLECLCGDRTIATSGYKRGHHVMEENRRIFDSEASRDKIFLLKYLYMLDRVFQAFCNELRRFEKEPDPIQDARVVIGEGWMEHLINEPVKPWVIQGMLPAFASPLALQGKTPSDGVFDLSGAGKNRGGQGGAGIGGVGAAAAGAPRRGGGAAGKQAPANGDSPGWHRELPDSEHVQEWRLPAGKKLADFFGPHKKENITGLPKVVHHKTGRPSQPCLRYQLEKCRQGAGCPFAHIRPRDIPREVHDVITSHIKGVYEKENS
jgi:hypothetical protein